MSPPDCNGEPYPCLLIECVNADCVHHWFVLRRREREALIVTEYGYNAQTIKPSEEFL